MHISAINKSYIFPSLLFLLVIVLSALGIHGSSIGVYNQYFYGPDYKDPNLLFGQVRPIRSDEWLVSSPWALAQVENNLQEINTLYLATQDLTLSDAPGRNWAAFFEPQNWGFLILPVEQAFAFRWWIKAFMLTTAAYILFMMMSEKNILVSIMAALSLTYAPFIQWWYSTSVTEITSFGILTFVFFLQILHNRQARYLVVNSLLFIYFAVCFSLVLYPPFQIPLVLFFAFVGAGQFLSLAQGLNKKHVRHLAIIILINVAVIGCILALYYLKYRHEVQVMSGTVYPGAKVSSSQGGQLDIFKALASFYNIQLLLRKVPDIFDNQSEASSFFFFSLFLLPYYLFLLIRSIIKRENRDYSMLFAITLTCLLLVWGAIGLPNGIAKALLLNYVNSARTLFMFGIANHLLILYFLSKIRLDQTLEYRIVAALYALGVCLGVLAIGRYLKAGWPAFIGSDLKIFAISILAGIMMALLLYQRRTVFFSLFFVFTLASTYSVNPLYRGLSPLSNNKLSIAIENIHKKDTQASWAAYVGLAYGNYIAANGAQVLNGTYFYPNLDFWHVFDPDRKYENIYNRYAHVVLASSTNDDVEFELLQGDVFEMKISPCNTELQELNVKYFLFASEQDTTSCLTQIDRVEYPNMTFYIYERTNESDESP